MLIRMAFPSRQSVLTQDTTYIKSPATRPWIGSPRIRQHDNITHDNSQSDPSLCYPCILSPVFGAYLTMVQLRDKDRQITIVLLGVTGAGKSTFAHIASGQNVVIGHGVDPCTQDPLAVHFKLGDRNIVLVDTPGFDDDVRSDVEILGDIAKWLAQEGLITDRPVDGLILLHPATHTFSSGNEKKRKRLLESILGDDAYSRVVIATTNVGES